MSIPPKSLEDWYFGVLQEERSLPDYINFSRYVEEQKPSPEQGEGSSNSGLAGLLPKSGSEN